MHVCNEVGIACFLPHLFTPRLMIGLSGLRGLLQIKQFYDSVCAANPSRITIYTLHTIPNWAGRGKLRMQKQLARSATHSMLLHQEFTLLAA